MQHIKFIFLKKLLEFFICFRLKKMFIGKSGEAIYTKIKKKHSFNLTCEL